MLDSTWLWYADIMPRASKSYFPCCTESGPAVVARLMPCWLFDPVMNQTSTRCWFQVARFLDVNRSQSKRMYANYSRWMQMIRQRQRDANCVSATTDRWPVSKSRAKLIFCSLFAINMQMHDKHWQALTSYLHPCRHLAWPTFNDTVDSSVLILAVVFHAWMCRIGQWCWGLWACHCLKLLLGILGPNMFWSRAE